MHHLAELLNKSEIFYPQS